MSVSRVFCAAVALCLLSAPLSYAAPETAAGTSAKAVPAVANQAPVKKMVQKQSPTGEFFWEEEIEVSPVLNQSENTYDGVPKYSEDFKESFPGGNSK